MIVSKLAPLFRCSAFRLCSPDRGPAIREVRGRRDKGEGDIRHEDRRQRPEDERQRGEHGRDEGADAAAAGEEAGEEGDNGEEEGDEEPDPAEAPHIVVVARGGVAAVGAAAVSYLNCLVYQVATRGRQQEKGQDSPSQAIRRLIRIPAPRLAKRRRRPRLPAVPVVLPAEVQVGPLRGVARALDAARVGLEEVRLCEGRAVGDAREDDEEGEDDGEGEEEEADDGCYAAGHLVGCLGVRILVSVVGLVFGLRRWFDVPVVVVPFFFFFGVWVVSEVGGGLGGERRLVRGEWGDICPSGRV